MVHGVGQKKTYDQVRVGLRNSFTPSPLPSAFYVLGGNVAASQLPYIHGVVPRSYVQLIKTKWGEMEPLSRGVSEFNMHL